MTTDPTATQHSSASTATLPVDEQVDSLFDALQNAGFSEEQRAHFQREIEEWPEELRNLGLGRRLIRIRREMAKLDREERLFLGQIAESRTAFSLEVAEIETVFAALVLAHREAKQGNFVDITGVGRWTTKKTPARWEIDNDAAITGFNADLRAEFVETPKPKPQDPKLKGQDLRRFLTEHHLDAQGNVTGELPAGVTRVEAVIKADYDLYD